MTSLINPGIRETIFIGGRAFGIPQLTPTSSRAETNTRVRRGKLRMEKARGTRGQLVSRGVIGGSHEVPPIDAPPTLTEMNLTKKESSRFQAIAALADRPESADQ